MRRTSAIAASAASASRAASAPARRSLQPQAIAWNSKPMDAVTSEALVESDQHDVGTERREPRRAAAAPMPARALLGALELQAARPLARELHGELPPHAHGAERREPLVRRDELGAVG